MLYSLLKLLVMVMEVTCGGLRWSAGSAGEEKRCQVSVCVSWCHLCVFKLEVLKNVSDNIKCAS